MSAVSEAKETLDVAAVQRSLKEFGMDGWLFYFFRDNDALAPRILKLPAGHMTRRWFYYIPAKGEPVKLVHRIEMSVLDALPGEKTVYLGWRELEQKLKAMLGSAKTVAMQYSQDNAVPYISRVDAGTVELIRKLGVDVVSSGDLVQVFEARWNAEQLRAHLEAVENLRKIVFEGFAEIRRLISAGEPVNEYMIQQFIYNAYDRYGMESDSPPIVAVNQNSGLPHYQPTESVFSEMKMGDFVLFDIWAKKRHPSNSVYADITWTGFIGETVPQKYEDVFKIVAGARDAAVDYVTKRVKEGVKMRGAEVDDVTRKFISDRGYGDDFVHRTGHSIGSEHVHGNGANIDNLETQDTRQLIPGTAFSIEPGIYLAEFGIRSEIDVYISDDEVIVGGQPIQTAIVPILG